MDFDTLILGVAALLFVIALVALVVWAFKAFFSKSNASSFRRAREKRLGVVETAAVDAKRKLYLIRRDDVEHLVIIGGPVDVVVETGIKGHPHLGPPHDDVIIAKTEARPIQPRPAPDFSKS
jgi:flagellar protein FliO/FliZ